MITKPEDVKQADKGVVGFDWDGESPHPINDDETVPNLESSMDWAEHQRIVFDAMKLMTTWTTAAHAGKGKDAFKALKDCYDGSNKDRSVLYVSKGIHQPEVNPHMQLRVVSTFFQDGEKRETSYTFHLDVTATEVKGVKGLDDSFQWEGVRFSYKVLNNWYGWPVLPAPPKGKRSTPSRRNSISAVSLKEHIDEQNRLEKERLRKEAADNLEEAIQIELERLEKEDSVKLRMLKNEPSPKFWKGTTKAYVVNKYSKGYYVIWDKDQKKLVKTI